MTNSRKKYKKTNKEKEREKDGASCWYIVLLLLRLILSLHLLLGEVDLVAHAERHALRLGAYADVAVHGAVRVLERLLDADVGEHVLAEYGLGVEVGGHEAAVAGERLLGRQALHVRRLDDVLEVLVEIANVRVDHHLVLPLEHDPHLEELLVVARRRHDVVHDVDVNVVEDDTVAVVGGARYVVDDVAEYDAVLGGGHLDVGLDVGEVAWSERERLRLLHELQVAEGGQLERQILQGVARLVDDEHVEHDVVLVDVYVGLGVHRVGEAGELRDLVELGREEKVVLAALAARQADGLLQRQVEHVLFVGELVESHQLAESQRIVGLYLNNSFFSKKIKMKKNQLK